jgi:hypothetical protein
MDLQVAHLILSQSTPLAIRFRTDEKRFDVDGAYNARYEIVNVHAASPSDARGRPRHGPG